MTGRPAADEQLAWIVAASARGPLPETEIRGHLASALLDASGGPSGVNAALAGVGRVTTTRLIDSEPGRSRAVVRGDGASYVLTVRVDETGLVDDLGLVPEETPPSSWSEVDDQLSPLGKRVSFAAGEVEDGRFRGVHGIDADTQRPIGSACKLYVLGALAQAVADGTAAWGERLAIREDWKSVSSGELPDRALTLAEFADHMISTSDNTATDHLIHRLGRDAVHRQLTLSGNQRPAASIPFLTTKALFQLKLTADAAPAERYLALPEAARTAALEELERAPLPENRSLWPRPRHIDAIEWFASPSDVCRAYAGLYRVGMPEIGHALSINDDGLALDPARFATTWYKGGNEPGVLSLNYLARTADDRALVVSLMVSDPDEDLDTMPVALKGFSAIRGAFDLLSR
ncbi:serine hydrolase [Amycolatopsis minnesotensis]